MNARPAPLRRFSGSPHACKTPGNGGRMCFVRAAAGFGLLWTILWGFCQIFPYVRSGADLVAEYKHRRARAGRLFVNPRALHVVVFGHSKVLAGFVPDLFDRQMAGQGLTTESWNFGFPGDIRFMADLEGMIKAGNRPDLVLLTYPWPANERHATWFRFLDNDEEIFQQLFPFRRLPRDLVLSFLLGAQRGGIAALYRQSRSAVQGVETDRGYYFIERESHFPGDALPDNFTLASDSPMKRFSRQIISAGPVFERLLVLLSNYKIKCAFIPLYFRHHEFAPPAPHNAQSGPGGPRTLGPEYFQYDNRLFSDRTHLNRHGAAKYTTDLSQLLGHWLGQQ